MSFQENYKHIDWSAPIEIERKSKLPPARSDLPFPMILSDEMADTEHPCDGKFYSSKSTFERITRQNGCVTVGDDPARLRPKAKAKPDDKKISDAVERAVARVKRGELAI